MRSLNLSETILYKNNFSLLGHAFGSDIAINIAKSNALNCTGHYLVVSCGIGGSYGAMILEKTVD